MTGLYSDSSVLALIGVIFWVLKKKDKDTSDYFLAGRDATWIAIGASIFASNIGSEHLVGLAGTGAESGMAFAHWEMHGWMILLLGWLFVPFYARSGVFTMPEFLEKRYNSKSRSFLSIISLVSYILTKVAVTVYAGGVVFKDVFNIEYVTIFNQQIDFFWVSAIGLVVLTGLYTVFGGMKAVLYTSILQTPILLAGSIAILVIGLTQLGGWGNLMEIVRATDVTYLNDAGEVIYRSTTDSMASLIRSPGDPKYPWTGVILGSAIIGFWYWCTDQFIVQRVLSGRDQKQARRGTIFGAYLKLTPVFLFLIPGMIAFALKQQGTMDFATNDAAFSTLVKDLLPKGFTGIVVGGILAALMSSLASLFNSSSMLFTVDFYQKIQTKGHRETLCTGGQAGHGGNCDPGNSLDSGDERTSERSFMNTCRMFSHCWHRVLLRYSFWGSFPKEPHLRPVLSDWWSVLSWECSGWDLNIYYGDTVADGFIYRADHCSQLAAL